MNFFQDEVNYFEILMVIFNWEIGFPISGTAGGWALNVSETEILRYWENHFIIIFLKWLLYFPKMVETKYYISRILNWILITNLLGDAFINSISSIQTKFLHVISDMTFNILKTNEMSIILFIHYFSQKMKIFLCD